MRCPNCKAAMKLRKIAERDLGETLGLTSVLVRKLPAYACDTCDEILVPGPVLEGLQEAVVRELLSHSFPLGSVEVRFLRKAVGLTQADLAQRLGVDRVSVARWETQDKPLAGPESIAVRAVIAAAEGSPIKAQPVERLRLPPESHPARLELDAPALAS